MSHCTSKFSCKHCNKKHHTSLCHALGTSAESTRSASEVATNQVDTSATTQQTDTTVPTSSFTTVTAPPPSALYTSVCLLKTAIADISAESTTVEGHILLDEGAQRSFITQELVDTLQLQPTRHELITVSSFGAQVSTPKKFAVATICIHTLNGGRIPVSVLVVPKLAAPIRNSVRTCLHQLPYLKGLYLAHPITSDDNFHVSVLVGADHYWQFIQDHIVRGNGPTAVQSRLGYLLSGPLPVPQVVETSNFHISMLSCITEEAEHTKKKIAVRVWMIPFRSVRPLHLGLVLDFKCLLLLPLDIYKVSRVVSTHFLKWSILKQPLKRPSCGTVAVLLP